MRISRGGQGKWGVERWKGWGWKGGAGGVAEGFGTLVMLEGGWGGEGEEVGELVLREAIFVEVADL